MSTVRTISFPVAGQSPRPRSGALPLPVAIPAWACPAGQRSASPEPGWSHIPPRGIILTVGHNVKFSGSLSGGPWSCEPVYLFTSCDCDGRKKSGQSCKAAKPKPTPYVSAPKLCSWSPQALTATLRTCRISPQPQHGPIQAVQHAHRLVGKGKGSLPPSGDHRPDGLLLSATRSSASSLLVGTI